MRDLEFIAARWVDLPIPKEKRYLLKYLKTPVQRALLRYYMVFGDTHSFTAHTGYFVTQSYRSKAIMKIALLERLHAEAKASLDVEQLWKIESGRFKLYGKDGKEHNFLRRVKPETPPDEPPVR